MTKQTKDKIIHELKIAISVMSLSALAIWWAIEQGTAHWRH